MPSMAMMGKYALRALSGVDEAKTIYDFLNKARGRVTGESPQSGGTPVKKNTREDRIEAVIIQEIAHLYSSPEKVAKFIEENAETGIDRLDDFLTRNPNQSDRYEKTLGMLVWSANKDGLGVKPQTVVIEVPQGGNKPPKQKEVTKDTPMSDPVKVHIVFLITIGRKALALDNKHNGDKVAGDNLIISKMERLEKASVGDEIKKVANEGVIAFTTAINAFCDGREEERALYEEELALARAKRREKWQKFKNATKRHWTNLKNKMWPRLLRLKGQMKTAASQIKTKISDWRNR